MDPRDLAIGTTSDGGARLRVRAKAGARRTGIDGVHAGALKVSVTAAPERGRANEAIERLLAESLGLPPSTVRVVSGHTAREKTIEVSGLGPEEVARRLNAAATAS